MTSQIINVAIVLIGIYIALSVVCSWLQEQVAALLKLRSSTLRKGILELVSRDADVFAQLSTHPLIAAASSETRVQFPSYVSARNFTLAFWQSVGPTVDAVADSPLGKAISDPKEALTRTVDAVNDWNPSTDGAKDVKRTAIALLNSAEGNYDRLLDATDTWFNAQMDRVGGWYRRTAQYFLIVIALALAFGAGVDTLDIGRQLYAAPAISEAVAQSVSTAVQQHSRDTDPQAGIASVGQSVENAQALLKLRVVRPGWWIAAPSAAGAPADPTVSERIFGILITAIAVSLGAPFWFDVLKGLVNVRMAGGKPNVATQPGSAPSK